MPYCSKRTRGEALCRAALRVVNKFRLKFFLVESFSERRTPREFFAQKKITEGAVLRAEAFESGRGSTLSRRGAASIQFVAFCGQ